MTVLNYRSLTRLAVAGVVVATLGLTGCGRKSGLDPPPEAGISKPGRPGQQQQPQPETRFDAEGRPIAPPASQRKNFFLDWLID